MGMRSKSCPTLLLSKTDRVLVNEVNTLDNRFSTLDFREELPKFWSLLANVNLDREMVETLLLGVKQRNIPGPDGIGGRILENYALHFFFALFSYCHCIIVRFLVFGKTPLFHLC